MHTYIRAALIITEYPLAASAQRVSKRRRYKEGEGERHVHLWGTAGRILMYVPAGSLPKAYQVFTFPDGKCGRQEVTLWGRGM